jgi:hypothetical protein
MSTTRTVAPQGAGARPRALVRTLPTATRLRDPDLRRFVDELTDVARLELARKGRRGKRAVVKRTNEVIADARRLGVDLDDDRSVVAQLDLRSAMPVAKGLAAQGARMKPPAAPASRPAPRAGAAVDAGVRFAVRSVTCDDETDPEFLGRDDIALGGFALNADGTTTTIEERFIGKFNDGDRIDFDPPLELADLSVRGATFPATVGVILGLSEKDLGGFAKFLADAFDQVKGLVKVVFEAVGGGLGLIIGAKIGAELGTAVGTAVGGPIGAIIGLVAGIVLGGIIGGVVAIAGDDIFVPSTTTVSLETPDATFDGATSTDVALSYAGFSGRYTVAARWDLVR